MTVNSSSKAQQVVVAARKFRKEFTSFRMAVTDLDYAPWVTAYDKLQDALDALDATTHKGEVNVTDSRSKAQSEATPPNGDWYDGCFDDADELSVAHRLIPELLEIINDTGLYLAGSADAADHQVAAAMEQRLVSALGYVPSALKGK